MPQSRLFWPGVPTASSSGNTAFLAVTYMTFWLRRCPPPPSDVPLRSLPLPSGQCLPGQRTVVVHPGVEAAAPHDSGASVRRALGISERNLGSGHRRTLHP